LAAKAFAAVREKFALTKKEITRRIAAELNVDQVLVKKIVQQTLDTILRSAAREGRIELRNFGVFEVKRRAARKARNPKTNEEVFVPAKSILSFQPGKNVASMILRSRSSARPPARAN